MVIKLPEARKAPPLDASIAMINIVFLLLLFFIVSGTVNTPEPENFELTESEMLRRSGTSTDALYVHRSGDMIYQGEVVTVDSFAGLQDQNRNQDGPLQSVVQVFADRRLSAQKLMSLLNNLESAGLENLVVVTKRRAVP